MSFGNLLKDSKKLSEVEALDALEFLQLVSPLGGVATFMKSPASKNIDDCDIAIVGVAFDCGATFRSGTRHGPQAIREQSACVGTYGSIYPWKKDLFEAARIIDLGDLPIGPGTGGVQQMLEATEILASEVFKKGKKLLTIGGDHTIPYGPIRAAAKEFGPITLIHLDSHQDSFDSTDEFWSINHGTFATDLINEGCIDNKNSYQVYIRTYLPESPNGGYNIIYAEEAIEMGAEKMAAKIKKAVGDSPVYLTLDMDALDPAFAPGTGSPVAGGPSSGEVRKFIQHLKGINLIGADIVEMNPFLDHSQATAITASFLLADLLYVMALK